MALSNTSYWSKERESSFETFRLKLMWSADVVDRAFHVTRQGRKVKRESMELLHRRSMHNLSS